MSKSVKKKKHPILVIFGAGVAFASAIVGGSFAVNRKLMKKMEKNKDNYNMMNSVVFNNGFAETDENTDNAYVSCIFGNMNVTVKDLVKDNINIEVFNLFGNTKITVPKGVEVVILAENNKGNIVMNAEECEEEIAPTVTVIGKNMVGNVIIETEK